jgi:hypothetical protein
MRFSPRLRSSTALAVVLWLFGSTTLALALCAFEGRRARCAGEMAQQSPSHESCHRSEQRRSTISCYCESKDATLPASTAGTTAKADVALNVSQADIVSPIPASDGWRHVHFPALLILRPHLFTLFSTYLI